MKIIIMLLLSLFIIFHISDPPVVSYITKSKLIQLDLFLKEDSFECYFNNYIHPEHTKGKLRYIGGNKYILEGDYDKYNLPISFKEKKCKKGDFVLKIITNISGDSVCVNDLKNNGLLYLNDTVYVRLKDTVYIKQQQVYKKIDVDNITDKKYIRLILDHTACWCDTLMYNVPINTVRLARGNVFKTEKINVNTENNILYLTFKVKKNYHCLLNIKNDTIWVNKHSVRMLKDGRIYKLKQTKLQRVRDRIEKSCCGYKIL